MQNYYYNGVDLNMFDYATSLRNSYDYLPVIVIVLLLKDTYHDVSSFELKPYKKPLNETNFAIVDDYVWVLFLDLYYIVDCLNEDKEPNLGGLELSHIGKEWIKLLTVKHWMESGPIGGENDDRYPIPKNLSNSKEIISALMILNSCNNSFITKMALKEKERQIISSFSNNFSKIFRAKLFDFFGKGLCVCVKILIKTHILLILDIFNKNFALIEFLLFFRCKLLIKNIGKKALAC